jgi:hypothetical protein
MRIDEWMEMEDDDRTYVRLVPLTEGGGIDLDDGTLDERVGTDELVVGCVVYLEKIE